MKKPSKLSNSTMGIADAPDGMTCIDYAHSYMWPYDNAREAVRVAIESRTILYDDHAGTTTAYYLGASCKSEDTYGIEKDYSESGFRPGAKTLFLDPNYDFTWIIGDRSAVIFRRGIDLHVTTSRGEWKDYRDVRADSTREWGEPHLQLQPATGAYAIRADTFEPAARATEAGDAIISQTQIEDASTGLRAVIECPVKTMNLSREGSPCADRSNVWQIDTGPVGIPDLTTRYDPPISAFSLGFIATISRHPNAADFVLEQPTQLPPPNEGVHVLHYGKPFSLRATNRLVGIPRLGGASDQ